LACLLHSTLPLPQQPNCRRHAAQRPLMFRRTQHNAHIKTPQGTATLNGSIDLKKDMKGAKHSSCDAYFVEMQKKHGKCKILHW
jgi:hypothetical protein